MLIVTMANNTELNPATPATRSGRKYVQSSADEGERRASKLPVRILILGTSSARRSAQVLAEKKAAKRRNSTSGALSAQVLAEVAEEAPTNPPEPKQFEDHGTVVIFGELPKERCLPSKGTMIRMTELLDYQHRKKIHPYDVIIERRPLADKANKLL